MLDRAPPFRWRARSSRRRIAPPPQRRRESAAANSSDCLVPCPARHFSTEAGSSLASIGATVNRTQRLAIHVTATKMRAFCHRKLPMSLETNESEKRKFLRFMKGNRQRRLMVGPPGLFDPLYPPSLLRD